MKKIEKKNQERVQELKKELQINKKEKLQSAYLFAMAK
jgi:hypothetical protein